MHRVAIAVVVLSAGCWTSSKASASGPIVGGVGVRGGELVYESCGFEYVAETDHDLTSSIFPTGYSEFLRPQPCGEVHVALGEAP